MKRFLPVLAWCLTFGSVTQSSAQQASIGVACNVSITGAVGLPVTLHGTLNPVKTARFKVVSSCPSLLILPSEFDLTFATCVTSGANIATITVVNLGAPLSGCNFDIVPLEGDDWIELTDCDGFAMRGRDTYGWSEPCDNMSGLLGPYRPAPADGAIDVPVDTQLEFIGSANHIVMADFPFTNMGPPEAPILCSIETGSFCTYPVNPGVLQPNTTYYWQAYLACFGCHHGEHGRSEIFSFTTGGTVAIESTTWGRVKSMYRD